MIRYAITRQALRQRIRAERPDWEKRASKRTARIVSAGTFDEKSSIWSEIKPVYMDIQAYKCVFCERRLGGREFSRIEHDLEHFRPKRRVSRWPSRTSTFTSPYPLGNPSNTGYYWLAYDMLNYAASCKTCNSTLKSNAFPVFRTRGTYGSVSQLKEIEEPVLCYPIGKGDADPESLIEFVGTIARARGRRGKRRARGEVLIEFFGLNVRDELQFERATWLNGVGGLLDEIERGVNVPDNQRYVNAALYDDQPHAACIRSFARRWHDDRPFARELWAAAKEMAWTRRDSVDELS